MALTVTLDREKITKIYVKFAAKTGLAEGAIIAQVYIPMQTWPDGAYPDRVTMHLDVPALYLPELAPSTP
jgi:hypothetical protein